MQSLIELVRHFIGENGTAVNSSYGGLMEYTICGMLLILVVAGVFKILINLSNR